MFEKYKEIFFGLTFGIFAVLIDTAVDAKEGGYSFSTELTLRPGMMLYRALFILLGFSLG